MVHYQKTSIQGRLFAKGVPEEDLANLTADPITEVDFDYNDMYIGKGEDRGGFVQFIGTLPDGTPVELRLLGNDLLALASKVRDVQARGF